MPLSKALSSADLAGHADTSVLSGEERHLRERVSSVLGYFGAPQEEKNITHVLQYVWNDIADDELEVIVENTIDES